MSRHPQQPVASVAVLLSVVWFVAATAELPRLEHDTAAGSLAVLVVGDWGRKGAYNQTRVATQLKTRQETRRRLYRLA
ncbi:unnamed protein product [Linum tenue]|uniref:Uncharacterized protein n=1 Tax=Linum tenue TaxID=586396 RepID=A0AAV0NI68_9ROSI|nr:unnamed protein product [Linum tenue]